MIEFCFFRLKEHQAERPEKYTHILATPAMQSLPVEITAGEVEMVKNVISRIPEMPDNN